MRRHEWHLNTDGFQHYLCRDGVRLVRVDPLSYTNDGTFTSRFEAERLAGEIVAAMNLREDLIAEGRLPDAG